MNPCALHDDGRHRYRFTVSRLAGTPYYGCGPSCGIVLPSGDGLAEDAAYVATLVGLVVTSCALCDREGEVGRMILVLDLDGDTAVCRSCAAIPEHALRRDLAERYGDDLVDV